MSTLKATNLQNASSATTNAVLNTDGTITTGANMTVTGTAVMSSPYTMRNKIINGAMVIDQRNAGAAQNNLAAGWVYTVDRWEVYSNTASRFNSQQNKGSVTPPAGFTNYLGLSVNTGYTPSAGDYNILAQPIEGFNVADLGWGGASAKTVTLSFQVYSSITGTHSGFLANSPLTTAYPFTFTVSSANTWTSISVTVSGPTSGTFNTNNTVGIYVGFNLGNGSNFQTASANAWNSSAKIQPSSAVSIVGTSSATFYITGVQLEQGTIATPFEYRNYQQELAMCQRYYQVSGRGLGGVMYSTSFINGNGTFPVQMRTSPTVALIATNPSVSVYGTGDLGKGSGISINTTNTGTGPGGFYFQLQGYTGGNDNRGWTFTTDNVFSLNSEL